MAAMVQKFPAVSDYGALLYLPLLTYKIPSSLLPILLIKKNIQIQWCAAWLNLSLSYRNLHFFLENQGSTPVPFQRNETAQSNDPAA
jgi:hypothetical protein